jgi:hypothetical protein
MGLHIYQTIYMSSLRSSFLLLKLIILVKQKNKNMIALVINWQKNMQKITIVMKKLLML